MARVRTKLKVDEEVLRAVRMKAARTGKRRSEVIEESLRRDLGLNELERIWAGVKPLSEEESMRLAVAEQHEMRRERHAAGGP